MIHSFYQLLRSNTPSSIWYPCLILVKQYQLLISKFFSRSFYWKKKCEPWFVGDENPSDLPVSNSSFNEEEILR